MKLTPSYYYTSGVAQNIQIVGRYEYIQFDYVSVLILHLLSSKNIENERIK